MDDDTLREIELSENERGRERLVAATEASDSKAGRCAVATGSALLGYVVELQPGCWYVADMEGDPGRTLRLENATVFPSIRAAEDGLTEAKKYRHWFDHAIRPLYRKLNTVHEPTAPETPQRRTAS